MRRGKDSFAKVAPIADQAAVLFYDRLFAIAPEVKPLFPGEMNEQRKKLMATLTIVVNGLSNLDAILPAASSLAKRHVGYGVKAGHYEKVGEALLWTLERGWPRLEQGPCRRMGHHLRHAFGLHDRRSLWAARRGRIGKRPLS